VRPTDINISLCQHLRDWKALSGHECDWSL